MRPEKLSPNWFGPYRVIQQEKNDILCEHVVMKTGWNLHTSRCKPYFGSEEEALEHGRYDYNQFMVRRIVAFAGNPHKRSTMRFTVEFSVGNGEDVERVIVPLSEDISKTEQFDVFVQSRPYLFPLRYTARAAELKIAAMNKLSIVDLEVGDEFLIDLRYFDGVGAGSTMWFDSLMLPDTEKTYVVEMVLSRWKNKQHTSALLFCPLFKDSYMFKGYDFMSCAVPVISLSAETHILVDGSFSKAYPQIFE